MLLNLLAFWRRLWAKRVVFNPRPRPALIIESFEAREVLAAEFNFLGDFNTTPGKPAPANLTVVGTNIYFTATTTDKGVELWKTDGTPNGNTFVKDIWPGPRGSSPTQLTNVGGTLFFTADDGTNGPELWKSDGTASGTVLVSDLTTGSAGTTIAKLTNHAGTLFFTANTGSGNELWKSDGTTAGTTIVKDIHSGAASSNPNNFTVVGSTLYFTAFDTAYGTAIWKTDGTAAGTAMAVDLAGTSLVEVNGKLVFMLGNTLCVSDGTQAGTTQITLPSSTSGQSLTNVNGTLYFTRSASLWKSDLTTAGTSMIRTFFAAPKMLTAVGNTLYFWGAFQDSIGEDLGKSDGTVAGTVAVALFVEPKLLTNVQGTLYYLSDFGALWRTDGTTAGSVLVKDYGGQNFQWITELVNIGSTVYFPSRDRDMLRSDGTAAGTTVISNSIALTDSSSFGVSAELNGELYISHPGAVAYLNTQGLLQRATFNTTTPLAVNGTMFLAQFIGLYKGNGTTSPTRIKTLSGPSALVDLNGTLYFFAFETATGHALWKSDGTTAGTVMVKQVNYKATYPIVNVNGTLFFVASDGTSGYELWKSDGTAAGTSMVRDILPGSGTSSPASLTAAGNTLFFTANNGTSGVELWRSNGTTAGTVQVMDIQAGASSSTPRYLTYAGGTLYFSADTTAAGRELWGTNTSTFATAQISDILSGTASSAPRYFTEVSGTVYFAANDANGRELWKTGGTAATTSQVRDIFAGTKSSFPSRLINFNGTLYFSANDGGMGYELWKSSGTSAGTVPIQNPDGSRTPEVAGGMWTFGNRLLFGAVTQLYGIELFVLSDTDYGDAATLTTFAQNGARHTGIGPQLGALRDTNEPNGLPSASANGDDTNGVDDEDLFSSIISVDRSSTVNLNIPVAGATANTRLSAWFDWNQDGDWDDSDEKVANDITVTSGSNTVPVTVPANSAPGVGISRWRISERAGLGTTGWSYTGEVEDHPFLIMNSINLTLPSTSTNDIIIRQSASFIQIVDRATSAILVSEPLISLLGINITGSDTQIDRVMVDYETGGFFTLPNGINLAGRGGSDEFSIKGTLATQIVRTDTAVAGQSQFALTNGSSNSTVKVVEFESLNLTRLASFVAQTKFTVGAQSYTIESASGVKLAASNSISGGTIASNKSVELPANAVLNGSGSITGDFFSGANASLQLTGDMTIGQATSTAGFDFVGAIETGPNTLTLLDSDRVGLFANISLGMNGSTSTAPGKLTAMNGATLSEGSTITGAGTIFADSLDNLASITGTSLAAPIVLDGTALGTGTLGNIELRGKLNPGAPTMITNYGAIRYAGTLQLDLRGNAAGTEHDQVSHSGDVTLSGSLVVILDNAFTPTPGTRWTLLKTTGSFTGQFSGLTLPQPVAGHNWEVAYTSNSVLLQLVDLAISIAPDSISENGGTATGTVTRTTFDTSSPLVISLSSSDTTEATVPSSVTIPAGANSATFPINAVDDAILDGPQVISITASGAGFGSVSSSLTVADYETLSLSISVASAIENAGSVVATVTRNNTDISEARTINLSSSDTTEIAVPASVTIPAGQASVSFNLNVIDDNLLDGTQTASVTAQSNGYVSASSSIDVLDLETLSLSFLQTTISELGGIAQARITRNNTNISAPLIVNIQSSDTSEATAPAQVTISAGASFAIFQISAVDDALLDGTQTVTFTASAPSYSNTSQSLSVTDLETLSLSTSIGSISENGGTAIGTVTRSNTDLGQAIVVTLVSSDTSEATVPATVTIPANQASATFNITAVDDTLLDGSQTVTLSASAADYVAASKTIVVTDSESLSVTIDRTSISEKGGTAVGTLRRGNSDITASLAVQVTSSDTSEALVPATVIVPAGAASVTFPITAVDDTLLDGTQVTTIGVSASGYLPASAPLSVTDYESLSLAFSLPAISENGGTAVGTVTRSNTDTAAPLTVELQSGDTTEATVPSTVTIAAGQASATFTISAIDDQLQDGTQTVSILAQASGYVDGTQTIDVIDSVALSLSIAPAAISENGETATGTVTRSNTNVNAALTVNLSSSDTSEATVPASVVIPAGQASVNFTITAVDDTLLDGSQTVTLSAAAAGYSSASKTLAVLDFEQLQLTIDASSISEAGGATRGRVTRLNTDISSSITVQLNSSDMSEAGVPAEVVIPANQSFIAFDIAATDDTLLDGLQNVVVTASAAGYQSVDASLSVSDSEDLFLQLSADTISEKGGQVTVTVRRSNTDLTQPLTITLAGNDATEANVPATIVIPANQSSTSFLIDAVDDSLLDGSQLVNLQASASGYNSATTSLTVLDYEALTLSLTANSISESGGQTTATVRRPNTNIAQSLVVQLFSSDTTEATVPTTVIIPANADSVSFEISAVDDALLDGSQAVGIAANATGYIGIDGQLTVTDYENLTITLAVGSISEEGGSTVARVTRGNTDTQSSLTIDLLSSDTTAVRVPASVVFPAGQPWVEFTVEAVDDNVLDGDQAVTISASETNYVSGSANLVVTDLENLQLDLSATSMSEQGGVIIATLTRLNSNLDTPLTVTLHSSDPSEAAVPTTVVIPAGQSTITVSIASVDDQLLDGTQSANITATATGYRAVNQSLNVTDSEKLSISLGATSLSEAGGSTTAVVTRSNTDQGQPLTVLLNSNDTSEATVPASVIIPANQASVSFEIRATDDTLLDGSQAVMIGAQAAGYDPGSQELTVTDVETLTITLSKPNMREQADSIIATITRSNTNTAQPLDVAIQLDDSSEASSVTHVVIPANADSAQVTLASVDDDLLDGTQTVILSVSAATYVSQPVQLDVLDFEQLFVSINQAIVRESDGRIAATLTRSNTDFDQPLTVQLSSNDLTELAVPALVTIPAGQSSVQFEVDAIDDRLLDGSQAVELSAIASGYEPVLVPLSISDSESLTLQVSGLTMSEQGGQLSAVLSRSNTDNTAALVVTLQNSDSTELSVPTTITIPAGASSVDFIINALDDQLLDGIQSVQLIASASGYASSEQTIQVLDAEALTLTIDQSSIAEKNGSAIATVRRSNSDLQSVLIVQLSTSDTTEVSLPSSVTIPAGDASVQFTILSIDDSLLDGLQTATITATAAGYADGNSSLGIEDNERLFPWQNPRSSLDVNDSGQVTALDALLVINGLNTRQVLTPVLPDPFDPVAYVDVNGDGVLTPLDALLIINHINTHPSGEGESILESPDWSYSLEELQRRKKFEV